LQTIANRSPFDSMYSKIRLLIVPSFGSGGWI
jgi:hypothetical protein